MINLEKNLDRSVEQVEFRGVRTSTSVAVPRPIQGDIRRLVSLFPNAKPVYIPLRVRPPAGPAAVFEKTSALFIAANALIFLSDRLHRNGETLLLSHFASSDESSATVVALLYDEPRTAVAVQFLEGLPKWIRAA